MWTMAGRVEARRVSLQRFASARSARRPFNVGDAAGSIPCGRDRPAGRGFARRAINPGREAGSLLSVVVPAKNEAASLPQLVAEIAAALRPLSGVPEAGPPARRVRDRDRRRWIDRRDPGGPAATGSGLPRVASALAGVQRGPVGGDRRGLPRGAGRLGGDARRRPSERPGRPGGLVGGPAGP